MAAYIFRRLLLVIPTLWAIITINFFIIQIALVGLSNKPWLRCKAWTLASWNDSAVVVPK